ASVHQRPDTTVLWRGGSFAQVSTYSRVRAQVSSRRVRSVCEIGAPLIAARRARTTGVSSAGAVAPCSATRRANGSACSGWGLVEKKAGAPAGAAAVSLLL